MRIREWQLLREWVHEQTGNSKNGLGGAISSVARRNAVNWTLRHHQKET